MAGRLTSIRGHGRLSFATLDDVTGKVQLLMQESALTDQAKLVLANLDLGDWIGAEGEVITSPARGALGRCDRVVAAVQGAAPTSRQVARAHRHRHPLPPTGGRPPGQPGQPTGVRHPLKAIAALRRQLVSEDFVEVDTPILQPQAGGALARPFMTHANALDIDLSLRIAPELYLKRLVVGGYERVFEIARNFRNEGVDTRHSPEFTALEAYRAFGDVTDGMDLTERLMVEAARAVPTG